MPDLGPQPAAPGPRVEIPSPGQQPEPGQPNFDVTGPEEPGFLASPAVKRRLRLGLGFAFIVSLTFHSSILSLFVMGTAPGALDGQEGIAVEVITQQQYDLMVGNGSSQGGVAAKVETTAEGAAPARRTVAPSQPTKSEAEPERRQAPDVISSKVAEDALPDGRQARLNAAIAELPNKSDRKPVADGSASEATPARRNDPKEKPDSETERSRDDKDRPTPTPGAEGGATRRVASRGTVGEQNGPLPPTMRQALMQLLQRQIEVCYESPAVTAADKDLPLILIRLKPDGHLNGVPKSIRFETTEATRLMTKAALKAVRQCAPYRLPPRYAAYYDDWKEIRARFEFAGR